MTPLLDTSILIDHLRSSPRAAAYIESLKAMPSASVVSVAELYAGLRSQRDERHIELMVSKLHVLPVTAEIGRQAGQFMRHYGAGHAVELGDALVAATAEQHGLALATLNVKHFPMFPRLKAPY